MSAGEPAIRARGLRKAYRVYSRRIDPFLEIVRGVARHSERVALDSIDLELKRGEIVGILGRNGAGKSTLLKIIAGTLERTSGELEIQGRITAILELGTGFHPEYTGRENIVMGGLCLGMSRAEVESKLDSIIEFSELREVIDRPFKTYSTGMQARLTFSTAISVDPDILIVDEALSVGDARFQMKCFSWIQRLRQRNATILLVSHDTSTITTFCDRALILENGRVFAEGDAKPMTVLYHKLLFGKVTAGDAEQGSIMPAEPVAAMLAEEVQVEKAQVDSQAPEPYDSGGAIETAPAKRKGAGFDAQSAPTGSSSASMLRYGTGEAKLLDWGLYDDSGDPIAVIETGTKCCFSVTIRAMSDIEDASIGFAIKDRKGTVLWGVTNVSYNQTSLRVYRGETLILKAPCTMWLASGDFFVTLGIAHLEDGRKIDFIEDAVEFKVVGPTGIFTTSVVNLETRILVNRLTESDGPETMRVD